MSSSSIPSKTNMRGEVCKWGSKNETVALRLADTKHFLYAGQNKYYGDSVTLQRFVPMSPIASVELLYFRDLRSHPWCKQIV